jgi:N-acetylglucosamine kinase-like BadF-type ATPase
MILIADSGSTKTAWRLVNDKKEIFQYSTQGFNPFFQSTEQIAEELKNVLLPEMRKNESSDPDEVFFYGAGCSSEDRCNIVRSAISTVFPKAAISIDHDLLGAARATCGRNEGIATILGTGSNSCLYDGDQIVDHITSLGYILGDEGSGSHIGKEILRAYIYRELPDELRNKFEERFKPDVNEILESVYKKPLPNRYLASFSKFVFQNSSDPFINSLVAKCFSSFIDHHIRKYEGYTVLPTHVVGSVGFYYSNILRAVATEKGVYIDKILEAPIAGLTLYHLNEE